MRKIKTMGVSVIKSPILHFCIFGAIAYLLYAALLPRELETIHITTQTIDALVQQQESLSQTPITPEMRQELVENHIEEEILLREAYKRGIDKNDFRVRRRVLYIMRTSLSEVIPEPTVGQLQAFYKENKDQYLSSPSLTFEHVYFSFVNADLPEDSGQFIEKLQQNPDASEMGEYFVQGKIFRKTPFRTAASIFGKPFADKVFSLPFDTWNGPIESYHGYHYVRVIASHEPELAPFETMESYLRQDYIMKKMRESQLRKIEDMRENYKIVVKGSEENK